MIREEYIGPNIRRIREEKGFTLPRLAAATGFTKGYLSKIEHAGKAPPVATLLTLAKALDVDISDLFDGGRNPRRFNLLRRGERNSVARGASDHGYTYQPLAPGLPTKKMEPFVIQIPATAPAGAVFQHEGEEMLLVLRGEMKFFYGEEEHDLREGDCVYFDSGIPHRGFSTGDTEAECLLVIHAAK
ncbi:MAG: XRE family transcriptional regulator [Deferrisomatales bacterium]|nr:XRE family transcriptional regulator [Deferrisomatales bacterium]